MIEELLKSLPEINKFQEFCTAYKANTDTKVVICGCGIQGLLNVLALQEKGIRIWAFAENNPQRVGECVKGIKVIDYESLMREPGNFLFVNNDSYRDEKKIQLLELGAKKESIITFDIINPVSKNMDRQYIEENWDMFDKVYGMLSDDASRKIYINYLSGAVTGNMKYYQGVETGNDYFVPGITPKRDDHVYLDVGAYDGNTIESFMEYVAGKYDKIYAFEPFASSAKLIEQKQFPRTDIHVAAAFDKTGERSFYNNDDSGAIAMITTIDEAGANRKAMRLRTESIDDVIKGGKATMIKMDIEGSELAALHGAEKTIIGNEPFMAICVYHKREDLITIIPYIKEMVPKYKVYLRHHSNTAHDLVAYFTVD